MKLLLWLGFFLKEHNQVLKDGLIEKQVGLDENKWGKTHYSFRYLFSAELFNSNRFGQVAGAVNIATP